MITRDYFTKRISPTERQDLQAIADVEISSIELEDHPNLLVFPDSLYTYDRDFGKKYICSISKDGEYLTTNSIVGFVGRNNTHLSIHSRFSDEGRNDFFLHYLIQKVSKVNVLNLNHTLEEDSVFDFLPYLFPSYLKKALGQGLYKQYISVEHNDANIRGVININRHIKYNEPFNCKVAYRTREYHFDNHITQLIRHTIEYIASTPAGIDILKIDDEIRQAVKVISDATPSYSHRERHSIINKNLRPISHPYYGEYNDLQRLCLQILRHDELKYGQEENEIYGVLIDAAWLWEEYLADVLKSKFNHYVKDIGKRFYLFKNNIQRIIPDYLSMDRTIVADAKYIPLDQKEEYEDEKATAIYYKTIAYMGRFCSSKGYLLYPHKDCSTSPYTEYLLQSETQTINRIIIKVGMRIPRMCQDYLAFVDRMRQEETTFRDLIL